VVLFTTDHSVCGVSVEYKCVILAAFVLLSCPTCITFSLTFADTKKGHF